MGEDVGQLQGRAARAAVELVLSEPDHLAVVAQPIVDLTDGRSAGFELLARVPAGWQVPPDRLFAAARDMGVAPRLQAVVNALAVGLLAQVPVGCFLTLNLDPTDLAEPEVMAPLLEVGMLAPLVVEVTEQVWPDESGPAEDALAVLRGRGALLAVDDVGAGYSGLAQISRLRPEMVKLDRALVADLGTDPAAELVVDALGRLCGQLDAWVVAEGIERTDQLSVLVRLGVPLGQGFLLGRGAAPWPESHGAEHVRATPLVHAHVHEHLMVGRLAMAPAPGTWTRDATGGYRTERDGRTHRAMTMSPDTLVEDALLRAVARSPEDRWSPVLVTDATGAMLGEVRVESMVTAAVGRPGREAGSDGEAAGAGRSTEVTPGTTAATTASPVPPPRPDGPG